MRKSVHIENDKELTDENGVYRFSREALCPSTAKRHGGIEKYAEIWAAAQTNPILIIINSPLTKKPMRAVPCWT